MQISTGITFLLLGLSVAAQPIPCEKSIAARNLVRHRPRDASDMTAAALKREPNEGEYRGALFPLWDWTDGGGGWDRRQCAGGK
ncbi:hypothetical protein BV25DRAFT_1920497 [Artomyces pyxidatus]|uniref:Uncharacterized protein n=1 Tax=Artomyces pyxidatus TaxID=48021 RepID=A0ACB8SMA8_9AGAM|nr:hypothetical protein BV25DRAFT_1920497 [Artomyces pyxidatus]